MPKGILTAGIALICLTGCTLGPVYRQPKMDLPKKWPEHVLTSEDTLKSLKEWWMRFDDPTLDLLVVRGLDANLDIRLQADRIREAHARLGLATANRFPTVDLQAQASRERYPGATLGLESGSLGEDSSITQNLFSVSGMLGYEVDLWGRLAREQESAEALLVQSTFAHDAVRLNVVADVATTYFSLLAAQRELAITKRTLESRKKTLLLEKARYEEGASDEFTLRQAQSELAGVRALIPLRLEQVRVLESALAVLVGMEPAEMFSKLDFGNKRLTFLRLEAAVPRSLPSDLLRRRPDIRAAEAGLIATTADIGVAIAERFPRLDLASFAGSTASATGDMFTDPSKAWGVTASVFGPLIDFGRNRARVMTAKALRDQAETQYRITVTTAFQEVRDALVVYETSTDRALAVARQVRALRDTFKLAEIRYQEGSIVFLEVLDTERALLNAELGLTQAIRDRLNAAATLFKAMGGGWEAPSSLYGVSLPLAPPALSR